MNVKMEIKLEYAEGKHITLTEEEARKLLEALSQKLNGYTYTPYRDPFETTPVTYVSNASGNEQLESV